MPEQGALGEDFHAGGAVLGDEGPAVATLNSYHGTALEDVVHEALAVTEAEDDEAEGCHVGGG